MSATCAKVSASAGWLSTRTGRSSSRWSLYLGEPSRRGARGLRIAHPRSSTSSAAHGHPLGLGWVRVRRMCIAWSSRDRAIRKQSGSNQEATRKQPGSNREAPPEAIRSNQKQSEAIRSNQKQSGSNQEAIRKQSDARASFGPLEVESGERVDEGDGEGGRLWAEHALQLRVRAAAQLDHVAERVRQRLVLPELRRVALVVVRDQRSSDGTQTPIKGKTPLPVPSGGRCGRSYEPSAPTTRVPPPTAARRASGGHPRA